MAGHSKWANIQHRKGRQDAVRSKLFSKISKEITVAAKMGDPDVDKNPTFSIDESAMQCRILDKIRRPLETQTRL